MLPPPRGFELHKRPDARKLSDRDIAEGRLSLRLPFLAKPGLRVERNPLPSIPLQEEAITILNGMVGTDFDEEAWILANFQVLLQKPVLTMLRMITLLLKVGERLF
jgi:hypothetical protein